MHLKNLKHKDNHQIMGANQNMQDGWTRITADWLGELAFLGSNQDGAAVQMGSLDGEPALGPMQLILTGLAGCTGMDIVSILKKKRMDIEKFQVKIQGKRAAEHPRVYTEIEIQYLLWGSSLDEKSVEQAIQLSEEKYCSASAMLGAVAQIKSSYQLFETSKA
jgi:putative redox protein